MAIFGIGYFQSSSPNICGQTESSIFKIQSNKPFITILYEVYFLTIRYAMQISVDFAVSYFSYLIIIRVSHCCLATAELATARFLLFIVQCNTFSFYWQLALMHEKRLTAFCSFLLFLFFLFFFNCVVFYCDSLTGQKDRDSGMLCFCSERR